jgi:hypothetical protein
MPGEWITGADVMQTHGMLAVEIGKACYDEKLHAFTETLIPILEETKIGKIPKYPPIGVDRFQYIQYGPVVEWDWSNAGYEKGNAEALCAARSQIPNRYDKENQDLYEIEVKRTALLFMSTCYDYICNAEGEIKTFCFLIYDFKIWIANEPNYTLNYQIENIGTKIYKHRLKCNASIAEMILRDDEEKINEIYINTIKGLLFKQAEIAAWVHPVGQESPSGPLLTGSTKDNARITATRKACATIRAEIEQEKHGFQVCNKYKTNHDHFQRAVKAAMGNVSPHRDTMREEWKKVPPAIKHTGRVPEQ